MTIANLLEDITYNEMKPVVKVLFETAFTKEIRILLQKGTVMKKHQTSFPIVIEVVEGCIGFEVDEEVITLKKGNLIALDGGVPHSLDATEDSIIRLTLTKFDDPERVQNVVKSS